MPAIVSSPYRSGAALAVLAALALFVPASAALAQDPVQTVEKTAGDAPLPPVDEESVLPPETPRVEPDYPDVPTVPGNPLATEVGAAEWAAKPWPAGSFVIRTTPVVFIHGLSFGPGQAGSDCAETFATAIDRYKSYDHTGPFVTLKYYDSDRNCTHAISSYPDRADRHERHYPSGHKDGHHTNDTDIRHLAYHLAWYINDRWGSQTNVEIVAHSMGGLITRYAMGMAGRSGWPAFLMVSNVTTLGTPHRGSGDAKYCAPWSYQCKQMSPTSQFVQDLKSVTFQDPQGYGGTDWTLMGSDEDERVSAESAMGMASEHGVVYTDGVKHSDYYKDVGTHNRDVLYIDRDRGRWFQWTSAPRGVLWSSRAISSWTW